MAIQFIIWYKKCDVSLFYLIEMRTLISRWYLVKLLENQMDGNL